MKERFNNMAEWFKGAYKALINTEEEVSPAQRFYYGPNFTNTTLTCLEDIWDDDFIQNLESREEIRSRQKKGEKENEKPVDPLEQDEWVKVDHTAVPIPISLEHCDKTYLPAKICKQEDCIETIMHEKILGTHENFKSFLALFGITKRSMRDDNFFRHEDPPTFSTKDDTYEHAEAYRNFWMFYVFGGSALNGDTVNLERNRPISLALHVARNIPHKDSHDIRMNLKYLLDSCDSFLSAIKSSDLCKEDQEVYDELRKETPLEEWLKHEVGNIPAEVYLSRGWPKRHNDNTVTYPATHNDDYKQCEFELAQIRHLTSSHHELSKPSTRFSDYTHIPDCRDHDYHPMYEKEQELFEIKSQSRQDVVYQRSRLTRQIFEYEYFNPTHICLLNRLMGDVISRRVRTAMEDLIKNQGRPQSDSGFMKQYEKFFYIELTRIMDTGNIEDLEVAVEFPFFAFYYGPTVLQRCVREHQNANTADKEKWKEIITKLLRHPYMEGYECRTKKGLNEATWSEQKGLVELFINRFQRNRAKHYLLSSGGIMRYLSEPDRNSVNICQVAIRTGNIEIIRLLEDVYQPYAARRNITWYDQLKQARKKLEMKSAQRLSVVDNVAAPNQQPADVNNQPERPDRAPRR